MKYSALVLKNLFRSTRRTVLTVLSIAVSLFVFSALLSLPSVANQVLADTASSVRIACHTKMGIAYPLPEADKVRIAATPHVVAVTPSNYYQAIYHDATDQIPAIAADPERVDVMWPDWGFSEGSVERFKQQRTAALAAEGTMRHYHLRVGQVIQLRGTTYPYNVALTIVGTIARGPAPSFLLFHRDYLEELGGRPGIVDNFWVRADQSAAVPQVIASLNAAFANSSAETQCDTEAAFIGGFVGRIRVFFTLAKILGLIVVITIGLVALNTAAMSIRERRNEIAVMRSIGFPAGSILTLLVSESLLVAVIGAIIGCGSAFLLLRVFAVSSGALGPFGAVHMPATVLLEATGAALVIGIASAYWPARAASRRTIADALRVVD
jgi:putative ABC transport system permease protein